MKKSETLFLAISLAMGNGEEEKERLLKKEENKEYRIDKNVINFSSRSKRRRRRRRLSLLVE